jgi:hypothetical protein
MSDADDVDGMVNCTRYRACVFSAHRRLPETDRDDPPALGNATRLRVIEIARARTIRREACV